MTEFRPLRLLEVMAEHDVEFVVIGGIAAVAQGSPSDTVDLDICYSRDKSNCDKLADALKQVHAKLRGVDDDVPFILDGLTIQMGDTFTFETEFGPFDCLGTPSGTGGYPDLASTAEFLDLDGLIVRAASIDDLIRMKRAAGRKKDLIEIEVLGALRDEIDGAAPPG